MTGLLEHTNGVCPRCGAPLDRVDDEGVREFGEREYACERCGWTFETGGLGSNGLLGGLDSAL